MWSPWRVGLVAAALVSACGGSGSSSPDGTGSAGSGGAAGTGGAAGVGGAAGQSGACAAFTACGGDVVGTWRSDPVCSPATLSQPAQPCQGETFDAMGVASTATFTYRANKTMTIEASIAGPIEVQVSETCLAARGNGQTVTCTDASAGALYAKSIVYAGGKVGGSTCQPRADGSCACTITFVPDPFSIAGTYSTAGSVLTENLGAAAFTLDYCVSGATLRAKNRTGNLPVAVYLKQ